MKRQWFNNLKKDDWEFVLLPAIYFGKSKNKGSLYFIIGLYWFFWGIQFSFFRKKIVRHDWCADKHIDFEKLKKSMEDHFYGKNNN